MELPFVFNYQCGSCLSAVCFVYLCGLLVLYVIWYNLYMLVCVCVIFLFSFSVCYIYIYVYVYLFNLEEYKLKSKKYYILPYLASKNRICEVKILFSRRCQWFCICSSYEPLNFPKCIVSRVNSLLESW